MDRLLSGGGDKAIMSWPLAEELSLRFPLQTGNVNKNIILHLKLTKTTCKVKTAKVKDVPEPKENYTIKVFCVKLYC